jgi:serine/threonine-protein kinase
MGAVYRARQLSLNREVAIKTILTTSSAGTELARFRREAESIARLHHPNIVQIYEVGELRGQPYLVLEFVEGGSLKDRLSGTPLPGLEAARLIATLARAVHAAHVAGVIHRDLKPANILLTSDAPLRPGIDSTGAPGSAPTKPSGATSPSPSTPS